MNCEQTVTSFFDFPLIGGDDWRYTFATAKVRSLETNMLSRAVILELAGAADFDSAADLLSSSEYAINNIAELSDILSARRTEARELFAELMIDEAITELFRSRADFSNLRLAIRRTVVGKPIGVDYSGEGNVAADIFEEVFEQENYPLLPDYMQQAIERAVLGYYQNKDIRQIDYAIDAEQAGYNVKSALKLENVFLLGLFRIQIDLVNIRTMMRLKLTEDENQNQNVFLEGGFVETGRFKEAIEAGYEAVGQLFFATPYFEAVESGVNYFTANKSFLHLEYHCQEYLMRFLGTTNSITAGPQPIIAYLLKKENEIRTVRLIMTAKKNGLDTQLILDRLGQ